jgi:hypothetical protein
MTSFMAGTPWECVTAPTPRSPGRGGELPGRRPPGRTATRPSDLGSPSITRRSLGSSDGSSARACLSSSGPAVGRSVVRTRGHIGRPPGARRPYRARRVRPSPGDGGQPDGRRPRSGAREWGGPVPRLDGPLGAPANVALRQLVGRSETPEHRGRVFAARETRRAGSTGARGLDALKTLAENLPSSIGCHRAESRPPARSRKPNGSRRIPVDSAFRGSSESATQNLVGASLWGSIPLLAPPFTWTGRPTSLDLLPARAVDPVAPRPRQSTTRTPVTK